MAAADPRVTAIAERAAAPLRVAVTGRPGVGRGTVARALDRAGIAVAAVPEADVAVHVIAEVLKPEDAEAVAAASFPVLVVCNKADVAEAGSGVPMVALLAVADVDEQLWAALEMLAAEPAHLGGVDDFVHGRHRLPGAVRQRLCDTLDLFGITEAVAAIRRGGTAADVRALLHDLSGVDTVCARIAAVGAEVRYRRLVDRITELEALAAGEVGGPVAGFLAGDRVAFAREAAAVAVLEAAGLEAGPDRDAADQLRRAVTWRRYSRAPVSSVNQACAGDVVRASLRRWSSRG